MGVFVYRGPLPPDSDMFRGRADELRRLLRLCHREVEGYAIVYGGRQMGKTSLLLRLESHLPEMVRTCRLDFQGLPGASSLQVFDYLARRVKEGLPHLDATPDPPMVRDAPSLIEFLGWAMAHPETGQVVLLLEELGALPPESREDLAHVLRSMFTNRFDSFDQALTRLMVVLAGGIELYELAATQVSPLQNICEPIYLSDLDAGEAVGLVRDGLMELGLSPSEGEELGREVFAHVGGHPYLTQRLGGLLEGAALEGAGVTRADVARAAETLLSGDPLLHHLRRALEELHLLSAGRDLLDEELRFSRLDDEMARLELLGLSGNAEGRWAVRNRLLGRALREWVVDAKASSQGREGDSAGMAHADMVDRLEVRLRDFIDHRLTAVIDEHYWKRTAPGDVIKFVKGRVAEHLARHPYERAADFTSGRRRLDFCDAAHYEKIFLKNWEQFEPYLGRKDELQRHMAAYRVLRNCVQHNREPTEVERKGGEAALLWLSGILDRYEQRSGE